MAIFSITKYIRTDKPLKRNNKYPIYLRIRVKNNETKIPTGFEIEETKWDKKKREPRIDVLRLLLNQKIQGLELKIYEAIFADKELTIAFVKDLYLGKSKQKAKDISFYDYYLEFVERKKREGLNKESIRVYMTTFNVLKEFKSKISISDINLLFVEKFDNYMTDIRGNDTGGRFNKHKNLRTAILDMQKRGIKIENPYPFFKIPQPNNKEVFLTLSELTKLRNLSPELQTESPAKWEILQMYLFSCYCGLRFSDTLALKWENIDFENNYIRLSQKKTKSLVTTPLFTQAKTILSLFLKDSSLLGTGANVFPQSSEPTINKAIKELSKMVGITKHITYHSSRHTFATTLVMNGIDIYKISKYLGHRSVKTTERYLQYDLSIAPKDINGMNNIFE